MDVFDQNSKEYDQWFDDHPVWFQSELNALDKAVPSDGFGLEIGIGTGRFAENSETSFFKPKAGLQMHPTDKSILP